MSGAVTLDLTAYVSINGNMIKAKLLPTEIVHNVQGDQPWPSPLASLVIVT